MIPTTTRVKKQEIRHTRIFWNIWNTQKQKVNRYIVTNTMIVTLIKIMFILKKCFDMYLKAIYCQAQELRRGC